MYDYYIVQLSLRFHCQCEKIPSLGWFTTKVDMSKKKIITLKYYHDLLEIYLYEKELKKQWNFIEEIAKKIEPKLNYITIETLHFGFTSNFSCSNV